MSTSVTLAVPGSAGQTKTPTDCCASIFRAAPICPCIARPSSARSQGSSMKGRERPCSIRPQLRSSQNVLQRSVEPTANPGHSEIDHSRSRSEYTSGSSEPLLGDKLGSAQSFDGDPAALPEAERQMV